MVVGHGLKWLSKINLRREGERESAWEALGGISRGRYEKPSVTGGGGGVPFFFWTKVRFEEKKGPRSH